MGAEDRARQAAERGVMDDPELVHAKRLAALLEGRVLPDWFRRELAPSTKRAPRCQLEPWQRRLVDEYRQIVARREAQPVLVTVEDEDA